MQILVAEDDPVGRHLLQGLLTKWGYTVLRAADAALYQAKANGRNCIELAASSLVLLPCAPTQVLPCPKEVG